MIGIIGGYGNIGIEAADIIKTNSSEMIRVAGRNISKVSQRAKELFASDKWFQIKESSSNEWKDFIKGCRLVLCSAELGNETVECINRIAGELDCPIVYLGINLPKQEAEGKFIYGAGSIPGLSGIIPQYLAQDFDSVASIDFYYGAKGTFTYTAAKDYMDGVFNNSNRSYRAAKKNHVLFQMGDLYPNLIEVKNFIKCARYLNKKENPLYLRASFSPQVSYPAIDIISRIVPSIHTWKIKSITKELGPFDILMGEIGKTPIFIEYHNQVDPRDPDNYMHLLHSFTLFYSTGKLVLEDTFGPVLWKPRMHVTAIVCKFFLQK